MADLRELHSALHAAIADGGGHKVFFYAAGKNGAGLRHGYIAVVDPHSCQVNFEQLDNDLALFEIPRLNFIKVQGLAMIGQNPAIGANPMLDTGHVLNLLDPELQSASPGTPSSAAGAQAGAGKTVTRDASQAAVANQRPVAGPRLAYARLQEDATAVLLTYYGNSAEQKVADVAARFPPSTQPVEFLNACRQLTAVLVGIPKANEVLKPLYEKLG